ncbi:uncharacterized protein LOC123595637 isoform X2 [Leopardus geoffroyi]|uniref:uncharacterized protein LOC123595637 isoform X2 n=1 Tax=Leopardus geoffroyi TaxID=46844 RepID=UPI001E25FFC5|nr:uncharacterized protein LOC123595637 isoform X2 [Leopardus geoffroyi]
MAGGTTRWTYFTLCLMPHRSQQVDCVQGISAEALCLIFCIRPHSFSTRDACTNPWWGKRRRCDPEQLEECGNGSRHIPLASQWSVVPPLHLGPRPNSNKIRIKKGRHSSHTVPTEVRSGRSGSPRPGDLCLECAVILLSLFPETHGKTLSLGYRKIMDFYKSCNTTSSTRQLTVQASPLETPIKTQVK